MMMTLLNMGNFYFIYIRMFKLRGKALVDFLNKFQHFVVMAIEIGKSNNKMKKKFNTF